MVRHADPATPHLLIDARPLTGARNGITRFVEQLVAAWPASPGFRTTLISNRPVRSNARLPEGIECLQDEHPLARLPGTLWMTLRVPALVRRLGATHFLGTQHVLPMWRTEHLIQGVIVHDLVFKLLPETMALSNRLLTGFFAPKSIFRANHIFCVSNTTRVDLLRHMGAEPKRSIVCYPGRTPLSSYSSTVLQSVDAVRGTTLLVVGSLEPRKNLGPLLEAFLIAAKRDETLNLELVSGDQWGKVLGKKLWMGICQHPRVRIHRRISDEMLLSLYEAADYLIIPSIYEGFGLPILEAVGHCTVIANDIPIFREIAGLVDGVHLINLQTCPQKIAEDLADLISTNITKLIADDHGTFSWEITARLIVERMGLADSSSSESLAI